VIQKNRARSNKGGKFIGFFEISRFIRSDHFFGSPCMNYLFFNKSLCNEFFLVGRFVIYIICDNKRIIKKNESGIPKKYSVLIPRFVWEFLFLYLVDCISEYPITFLFAYNGFFFISTSLQNIIRKWSYENCDSLLYDYFLENILFLLQR